MGTCRRTGADAPDPHRRAKRNARKPQLSGAGHRAVLSRQRACRHRHEGARAMRSRTGERWHRQPALRRIHRPPRGSPLGADGDSRRKLRRPTGHRRHGRCRHALRQHAKQPDRRYRVRICRFASTATNCAISRLPKANGAAAWAPSANLPFCLTARFRSRERDTNIARGDLRAAKMARPPGLSLHKARGGETGSPVESSLSRSKPRRPIGGDRTERRRLRQSLRKRSRGGAERHARRLYFGGAGANGLWRRHPRQGAGRGGDRRASGERGHDEIATGGFLARDHHRRSRRQKQFASGRRAAADTRSRRGADRRRLLRLQFRRHDDRQRNLSPSERLPDRRRPRGFRADRSARTWRHRRRRSATASRPSWRKRAASPISAWPGSNA